MSPPHVKPKRLASRWSWTAAQQLSIGGCFDNKLSAIGYQLLVGVYLLDHQSICHSERSEESQAES
jgi:hypothetical protein